MARLREVVREENSSTPATSTSTAIQLKKFRTVPRMDYGSDGEDVENHEVEESIGSLQDMGKTTKSVAVNRRKMVMLSSLRENSLLQPFDSLASKVTSIPSVESTGRALEYGTKDTPNSTESREEDQLEKLQLRSSRLSRPASRGVKQRQTLVQEIELSSNSDTDADDSDNMSDFIVHDSCDSDEEDVSLSDSSPPPPRSTRRLVRGRKPDRRLSLSDDESSVPNVDTRIPREVPSQENEASCDEIGVQELENSLAILSFTPVDTASKRPVKTTKFTTPPPSPSKSKNRLTSPKKAPPRIPSTPHHQHHDDFWQIDVVNQWNDEYSPHKPLRDLSPQKLNNRLSPSKASPVKKSKAEIEAKKTFAARKHELATQFLQELDAKITQNKISELSAGTGGTKIVWSKTLLTTAGRANWKRVAVSGRDKSIPPTYQHHATIELADKVIDNEERLLNVVAHEFCHLANFMVSNIKTQPHGASFQAWGAKCSRAFGDRGVVVTTKHNYEIEYKYIWTCVNEWCAQEFKRQSKSIDPARHACGSCKSKLVQTKPVPRVNQGSKTTGGSGLSGYQMFVKVNMATIRKESPSKSHKEIMTEIGRRYQLAKIEKINQENVEQKKDVEKAMEDELDVVSRKLNFVDLSADLDA